MKKEKNIKNEDEVKFVEKNNIISIWGYFLFLVWAFVSVLFTAWLIKILIVGLFL